MEDSPFGRLIQLLLLIVSVLSESYQAIVIVAGLAFIFIIFLFLVFFNLLHVSV